MVEFANDQNPNDVEVMHRLNWLKGNSDQKGGMVTVLSYYNELARKFLLEGKFKSAYRILAVEFEKNLS